MADPRVVCIVGMHRSGTSLVSRILGLMGLSHGPAEHMMGPAEFNPRGHWEYQPLVDVNDAILASFGGTWDRPPSLPAGWHRDSAIGQLRERAAQIITRDFNGLEHWVWKDPRTSLTLPFWRDLLQNMRYVVCLRNPLDVALSLQRRDGFSLAKGGHLWLIYVASAILHTSGLPRIFAFYDELMRDWRLQVGRLAAFLGEPGMPDRDGVESAIDDSVDHSLEHHRSSLEQVLAEGAIPYPARALYSMLLNQTAGQPEEPGALRGGPGKADSVLGLFVEKTLEAHAGPDQNRKLEESQRLAATLQANLAESQRQAETLRASLAERELILAEIEHSLSAITQSRSWRLTGPLRWLAARLRSWIDRK